MGIWRYSGLITMDDQNNTISDACNVNVGDYVMTDMSVSRIFFKDSSKDPKMMLKFTIKYNHLGQDHFSTISVTPNHIMLAVKPESLELRDSSSETGSSDDTKIPEMLKCDKIRADKLKVGDIIPRWAGGFGIIILIEHTTGRSVQLMTENGMLMVDKNIMTCYVRPYGLVKQSSKPVNALSSVSSALVAKPFYWLPKKIYKFGIEHSD